MCRRQSVDRQGQPFAHDALQEETGGPLIRRPMLADVLDPAPDARRLGLIGRRQLDQRPAAAEAQAGQEPAEIIREPLPTTTSGR